MRLRRTLAGLLVLLVIAVAAVRLTGRQEPADLAAGAADHLPGGKASAGGPAPMGPSPRKSSPERDDQDGSTTTARPRPGAPVVPQNGTGRLAVVPVPGPQSTAHGRVVRYTVEVEGGLGVEPAEVARTVRAVLLDRRGWQAEDGVRFVSVSPAQERAGTRVDIRVTLASPGLTDRLCAPLRTLSQVSCWNKGRSVLNLRRWQLGDESYGRDVSLYRVYQINHEVGHGLGHQHERCPGPGRRAPVMLQQTLGLQGCRAWPYPAGA